MFSKFFQPFYQKQYLNSINNPNEFWKLKIKLLDWYKKPKIISNWSFENDVNIKWFEDGKLNVCYNCVDRHIKKNADKLAIIWESDDLKTSRKITYKKLLENVSKFANLLKKQGIKKGDVIVIYMPMIPEAIYAMLACARIGAIHSVVFAGFSADSLRNRIDDSKAKLIITADEGIRGGKITKLKDNVDIAIKDSASVKNVIVVRRTNNKISFNTDIDLWYHEEIKKVSNVCECQIQNSEDPLFILYTSGSTGKPKGLVHTSAGYLLYSSLTHKEIFNYKKGDVFWCTADIGWITGHSYLVYGPLSNGATILIHEGTPFYPDNSSHFKLIKKHKVATYYTAPTVIRALMREKNTYLENNKLDSLKVLGSVGEPLNSSAWRWYYEKIGNKKCPIIDTWWQTETGGILLAPSIKSYKKKPSFVGSAFYGIEPVLLDEKGVEVNLGEKGNLCIKKSWPGQARTIYNNHRRFIETYFSEFSGVYFSGDGAIKDKSGDISISGRVDDVINVAAHRLGSAELENAINLHPMVAESAVIGLPDEITGEAIYMFLILKKGVLENEELEKDLRLHLCEKIGPIAKPKKIYFVEDLPKTRSGKIMRRVLRKICLNKDLGDISTLVNIKVVDEIKSFFQ